MSNIAIRVEHLTKKYTIGKQKDSSLRGSLAALFSGGKSSQEEFIALNDVSFDIQQGDVVGIIGKNGAGKSTLLKVLSQITKPTKGRIEINGRVASLLEVGTGFHPELTGRENIYLNGTILGMTRKEVKAKFDEIVDFSGVKKFIDTPVKHYSSGMYVRLAFAVAAHLEPEILIIDEVLAVGDAEFQKKCLGKMQDVAGQGRTVLFVSHNMAAVKTLCNKGYFFRNGQLMFNGHINEVINFYLKSDNTSGEYTPIKIKKNIEVSFSKISVLNSKNYICTNFTCEDLIKLRFEFCFNSASNPYNLFIILKNQYGEPVFSAEKKIENINMELEINNNFLTRGEYYIHTFIHIPNVKQVDVAEDICNFSIVDSSSDLAKHGDFNYGSVFGQYKWIL